MAETEEKNCLQKALVVKNDLGLHARAAARIAQTVEKFDCQVWLKKDGWEAEADSVLSILTLDAPMGSTLEVRVCGRDSQQVLEALAELFAQGFGEKSE